MSMSVLEGAEANLECKKSLLFQGRSVYLRPHIASHRTQQSALEQADHIVHVLMKASVQSVTQAKDSITPLVPERVAFDVSPSCKLGLP